LPGQYFAARHRVAGSGVELAGNRERLHRAPTLQSPARRDVLIEDLRGVEPAGREDRKRC